MQQHIKEMQNWKVSEDKGSPGTETGSSTPNTFNTVALIIQDTMCHNESARISTLYHMRNSAGGK